MMEEIINPWPARGQVICEDDVDGFRWYEIDGRKYISVTQVLEVAQHFKLTNWFKNNSKSKIEKTKEQTAALGTKLHELVERDLKHEENLDVPQELTQAFRNWKLKQHEYQLQALVTEQTVLSKKYGYAGKLDMIVSGDFKEIKTPFAVGDLKSGRFSIKTGYQLAAYRNAVIEMPNGYTQDNLGMFGIQIHRDGSEPKVFEYQHHHYCFERFLYCLEIFKGLYYNKLKKMQWPYLEHDAVREWLGVIEHE